MLRKLFSLVLSLVILSAAALICAYAAEPANLVKGSITIGDASYPLAIADQVVDDPETEVTETTSALSKESSSEVWSASGSTDIGAQWASDENGNTVLETVWGAPSWHNSAVFTGISYIEDAFDLATQVWEIKVKLGSVGDTGYTCLFRYSFSDSPHPSDFSIILNNGGAYLGAIGDEGKGTLSETALVIVPEHTMEAGKWYTVRRVINSTKGDSNGAVQNSYDSIYDENGTLIGSTNGFVNCGNLKTGYGVNLQRYYSSIGFNSRRYKTADEGKVQFKDFKILDDSFTYTAEAVNMPLTKGDGQFIAYTPKLSGTRKTFAINKQGTLAQLDGQFKTQQISQKILFRDPGKEGAETYLAGTKIAGGSKQDQYSYAMTVKNSKVYPKGSDVPIATLEAFKWYTFNVVCNVNDGTADISIYEDETLVGSGTASGLASFTDWETTNTLYRIFSVSFFDSNINADTIYVDDLSYKAVDSVNTSSITFDGKTYTTSATATNGSGTIELAVGDELSKLGATSALDGRHTGFEYFETEGSAVIAESFIGNIADNNSAYKITFAGSDVDPNSVASGIYLKDANGNTAETAVYNAETNTATISFGRLTAGRTYTLVIDDNLKSKAYGVPNNSAFSLKFTMAGETEFDNTLIVNNASAAVSDGKLIATAAIHKGADNTTENAVLIAAAYNGNRLVGIDIKTITLSCGDIIYTTDGLNFEATEECTYKVFVWGSPITSLKPLN